MIQHETVLRVRYKETDKMGIVHHSNYLVWFELGRTEFLRAIDLRYTEFEEAGLGLPLIEANCRYISPAIFDDELRLVTTIKGMTRTRMAFAYQLFRTADNKLLAEGMTAHVVMKLDSGKPVGLHKAAPDIWRRLQKHWPQEAL